METIVAEEMLVQLELLDCPFVCDVDASYLSELLLVPSQHRMRILSWLISRIDSQIEAEIESFHHNPADFSSSLEIDKQVQLLTDIASSLGLCLQTDFALIRGEAPSNKHISFWKSLIIILMQAKRNNNNAALYESLEECKQALESIFRNCNIANCITSSANILPPVILKEIELSLKPARLNSSAITEAERLNNKLKILQDDLDQHLATLENFKNENPNIFTTADDPSQLAKINCSLKVTLGDLAHLQTAFIQVFENNFRVICNKEQISFSKLGSTLHNINEKLTALLEFFQNLKKIKEVQESVTSKKLEVLF